MTGTREEWLAARLELLDAEKALTRRSDELPSSGRSCRGCASTRSFDSTPMRGGVARRPVQRALAAPHLSLHVRARLQGGLPVLLGIADGFDGIAVHLANHDVTLQAVSRAPLAKLQAFKQRMGWTFPWASSLEQRLQLRLQGRVHRGAAARRLHRYNYRREPKPGESRAGLEAARDPGRADCGHDRHRRADLHARAPWHERLRARRRRRLSHVFDLSRGSTASGACISGSTARRADATSRAPGGGATTNTAG